jgi:hypothetical protein
MNWIDRGENRVRVRILSVAAMVVLLLAACGDQQVVISNGGGSGGGGADSDTNRYEELESLGLEPGEAAEGIHLQPGVETIYLDASLSDDVVVDHESGTVTVTGEAKREIEEAEEIWTDDILFGEDFIFLVDGARVEGDEIILDVRPFELLQVIHGEWDKTFGPHDPTAILRADVSDEGFVNMALNRFMENLETDANLDWDAYGDIDFPMDWEHEFRGRISFMGFGINTDYECESYTETRTRRRHLFFGEVEEYEVEVQPERFCIDYVMAKGEIGFDAEAGLSVNGDAAASYNDDHRIDLAGPGGVSFRAPLGSTGFALWMSPYVEGGVEASIEGILEASVDGSADLTIPIGFEYRPREDGFTLMPNDRYPITRNGEVDPELTGEVRADLHLWAKLGLDFVLTDIASERIGLRATGPELSVQFGTELTYIPVQVSNAGAPQEPCLTAAVYLTPSGMAHLRGEVVISERWGWGIDIAEGFDYEERFDLATYESEGDDWCLLTTDSDTLNVYLRWNEPTLLDLYMITPNGNEINYSNNMEDGGQYITVPINDPCLDDNSTCEATINWDMDDTDPPAGEYTLWVENVDGDSAANFEIEVWSDFGPINLWAGTVVGSSGASSDTYSFSFGQ